MRFVIDFAPPVGGDPNATASVELITDKEAPWLCPAHFLVDALVDKNPANKVVATSPEDIGLIPYHALPVPTSKSAYTSVAKASAAAPMALAAAAAAAEPAAVATTSSAPSSAADGRQHVADWPLMLFYAGTVRVSAFRDTPDGAIQTTTTPSPPPPPVWVCEFPLQLPEDGFPMAPLGRAWKATPCNPEHLTGVSASQADPRLFRTILLCSKTIAEVAKEKAACVDRQAVQIALCSPQVDDVALLLSIETVVNQDNGEALTFFQDRVYAVRTLQLFCNFDTLVRPVETAAILPVLPEDMQDEGVSVCTFQEDFSHLGDACRQIGPGVKYPARTACGRPVCFHHRLLHSMAACDACRATIFSTGAGIVLQPTATTQASATP